MISHHWGADLVVRSAMGSARGSAGLVGSAGTWPIWPTLVPRNRRSREKSLACQMRCSRHFQLANQKERCGDPMLRATPPASCWLHLLFSWSSTLRIGVCQATSLQLIMMPTHPIATAATALQSSPTDSPRSPGSASAERNAPRPGEQGGRSQAAGSSPQSGKSGGDPSKGDQGKGGARSGPDRGRPLDANDKFGLLGLLNVIRFEPPPLEPLCLLCVTRRACVATCGDMRLICCPFLAPCGLQPIGRRPEDTKVRNRFDDVGAQPELAGRAVPEFSVALG